MFPESAGGGASQLNFTSICASVPRKLQGPGLSPSVRTGFWITLRSCPGQSGLEDSAGRKRIGSLGPSPRFELLEDAPLCPMRPIGPHCSSSPLPSAFGASGAWPGALSTGPNSPLISAMLIFLELCASPGGLLRPEAVDPRIQTWQQDLASTSDLASTYSFRPYVSGQWVQCRTLWG